MLDFIKCRDYGVTIQPADTTKLHCYYDDIHYEVLFSPNGPIVDYRWVGERLIIKTESRDVYVYTDSLIHPKDYLIL